MNLPSKPVLLMATSLTLAGGAGALGAVALSASSQAVPTKTVTIDVGKGAKGDPGPAGPAGPAGPPGPAGPAGAVECNPGYSFGNLVINAPGGQVTIQTCIKD